MRESIEIDEKGVYLIKTQKLTPRQIADYDTFSTCPKCGLPMKHYETAGRVWDKCLSPFCGHIEYGEKEKK